MLSSRWLDAIRSVRSVEIPSAPTPASTTILVRMTSRTNKFQEGSTGAYRLRYSPVWRLSSGWTLEVNTFECVRDHAPYE